MSEKNMPKICSVFQMLVCQSIYNNSTRDSGLKFRHINYDSLKYFLNNSKTYFLSREKPTKDRSL